MGGQCTDEKLREIYDTYSQHGEDETCKILGIKHETLGRRLREYRARFKNREGQDQYDYVREEKDGGLELSLKSPDIRTIDELLAYAEIDTNIWSVWKSSVNKWGSGTNQNYQVKCWLKRKAEELNIEKICDYIEERIQKYSPLSIIKRKQDRESFLWEVGLLDHHMGQLSWHKEVGEDYDVDISKKIANEAISCLCDRVSPYKINKILYVLGHDFFNSASQSNTTTRGTVQDEDGRWQRSFLCGIDVHVDAINLLKKIADIEVVNVVGNHSEEREFYLGSVLSAWFRNDKNVKIDNRPLSRKYYRHGKNLLGLAHWDPKELKLDRLLGLMPIEAKEEWSKATNYEYHTGHLHHDAKMQHDLKTENGIKIRRLNTLVPLDAWHYNSGYLRIRETQSFLWHPEFGDMIHINYRI